jgi:hypothetical protein
MIGCSVLGGTTSFGRYYPSRGICGRSPGRAAGGRRGDVACRNRPVQLEQLQWFLQEIIKLMLVNIWTLDVHSSLSHDRAALWTTCVPFQQLGSLAAGTFPLLCGSHKLWFAPAGVSRGRLSVSCVSQHSGVQTAATSRGNGPTLGHAPWTCTVHVHRCHVADQDIAGSTDTLTATWL